MKIKMKNKVKNQKKGALSLENLESQIKMETTQNISQVKSLQKVLSNKISMLKISDDYAEIYILVQKIT